MRHLTRQLVLALQGELEHGDPAVPTFHRYEEPWAQWGGPNPDNVYTRAAIDPDATYRVSGNVAGVRAAIFSLVEGDMHLGRYGVFGEQTLADLDVAPDGALELWISPDRHDGNWIASHPDARLLPRAPVPVRLGTRPRRDADDRARRHARRAARRRRPRPSSPPRSTAPADVGRALGRVLVHVRRAGARTRSPATRSAPPGTPKGGAPNIAYGAGWWELAPGEALRRHDRVPRRRLLGLDGAPPLPARLGRLREPARRAST